MGVQIAKTTRRSSDDFSAVVTESAPPLLCPQLVDFAEGFRLVAANVIFRLPHSAVSLTASRTRTPSLSLVYRVLPSNQCEYRDWTLKMRVGEYNCEKRESR